MRNFRKRIERLEQMWLTPKESTEPVGRTWEDISFLCQLPHRFPIPGTMPKFLQAEYDSFNASFKRRRDAALAEASRTPGSSPSAPPSPMNDR